MFIGLTGAVYTSGISAGWLMVGWVVGDWLAWLFVHKRLREDSERVSVTTIPGFLAHGLSRPRLVAGLSGVLILVFLGVYASAQLTGGGKALSTFDIPPTLGVVFGALMVLAYCFAGGIRASIWTDAIQSVVMFGSMLTLLAVGLTSLGGVGAMWSTLQAIDATQGTTLTQWIPETKFGFLWFFAGWMFAGVGVVGQPHIMIRAMAINSPENIASARRIYLVWNALFAAMCISVGLLARAILGGDVPAEMAFPALTEAVLPSVMIGVMLAGLFAAIISTADSQVLSCSAALTQDITPRLGRTYYGVKMGTVFVTTAALVLALTGQSVFDKVTFAWSALAGALGPLMIVRVMRWPISTTAATTMIAAGLGAVLLWRFGLQWQGHIYDALPGMTVGFAIYGICSIVRTSHGT